MAALSPSSFPPLGTGRQAPLPCMGGRDGIRRPQAGCLLGKARQGPDKNNTDNVLFWNWAGQKCPKASLPPSSSILSFLLIFSLHVTSYKGVVFYKPSSLPPSSSLQRKGTLSWAAQCFPWERIHCCLFSVFFSLRETVLPSCSMEEDSHASSSS